MPIIQGGKVIEGAAKRPWMNDGVPTNGTSGTLAGIADPGDLLIDYTNGKLYQNANTKASPTWNCVGDIAESEIGTGAVTETKIADAAVSKGKLTGGFFKTNLIAGGSAGDHTISGITAGDELVIVLHLSADAHLNNMADLTSEFTVGAGLINNTGGTDTTGDKLLVIWLDITA